MKIRLFNVNVAIVAFALLAAATIAQNGVTTADKFLISAKAGAVNATIGDVKVERGGGRVSRLFKNDEVQISETVMTGTDGKVEILMNPGSYIRLGGNSSFEFDSTNLDDVRVKLLSGSAVFEVLGMDKFTVDVKAGNSRFALVDSGIYRVDLGADGNASVSIWKGKLLPGVEAKKSIGSGQKISYSPNSFTTAKFDRDEQDELMLWSSSRAKELSAVSASLKPSILRDTLLSSFYNRGWNMFESFGLWVYDPFRRSYCFLPFGHGWRSPYGFGYGRSLWYYNMPVVVYTTPPPRKVGGRPGQTRTQTVAQDPGFTVWKDRNSGKVGSDGGRRARDTEGPIFNTRMDRPMKVEAPIFSPPVFSAPTSAPTARPADTRKP